MEDRNSLFFCLIDASDELVHGPSGSDPALAGSATLERTAELIKNLRALVSDSENESIMKIDEALAKLSQGLATDQDRGWFHTHSELQALADRLNTSLIKRVDAARIKARKADNSQFENKQAYKDFVREPLVRLRDFARLTREASIYESINMTLQTIDAGDDIEILAVLQDIGNELEIRMGDMSVTGGSLTTEAALTPGPATRRYHGASSNKPPLPMTPRPSLAPQVNETDDTVKEGQPALTGGEDIDDLSEEVAPFDPEDLPYVGEPDEPIWPSAGVPDESDSAGSSSEVVERAVQPVLVEFDEGDLDEEPGFWKRFWRGNATYWIGFAAVLLAVPVLTLVLLVDTTQPTEAWWRTDWSLKDIEWPARLATEPTRTNGQAPVNPYFAGENLLCYSAAGYAPAGIDWVTTDNFELPMRAPDGEVEIIRVRGNITRSKNATCVGADNAPITRACLLSAIRGAPKAECPKGVHPRCVRLGGDSCRVD